MANILGIEIGSGWLVSIVCQAEKGGGQFHLSDVLVNFNFPFTTVAVHVGRTMFDS